MRIYLWNIEPGNKSNKKATGCVGSRPLRVFDVVRASAPGWISLNEPKEVEDTIAIQIVKTLVIVHKSSLWITTVQPRLPF